MVHEINPHTGMPVANTTEALGLGVNEGLGVYFGQPPRAALDLRTTMTQLIVGWVGAAGFDVGGMRDSMADLLLPAPLNGDGEKVSAATLKAVAKRVLLSHMRLGFCTTTHNPQQISFLIHADQALFKPSH